MGIFELGDDLTIPGRWFLRTPRLNGGRELDPRIFTQAHPVALKEKLVLPLRVKGLPLDFTLADFSMPVIRRELGKRLLEVADGACEMLPVSVEGDHDEYCILNVLSEARCLDEERSQVTFWTEQDGRPDKVGQYRMVLDLHIRPDCPVVAPVFRITGWKTPILVTEPVAELLRPAFGVALRDVS